MIKTIHIKNFKSLKDLTLQLGLRNVLVGPNMSGKSNLIDVFRFLVNMVAPKPGVYGLPYAFSLRNGFWEVAFKGDDSPLICFALDGEDPATNHNWSYELAVLGEPSGSVRVQDENLQLKRPDGTYQLIGKSPEGYRVLKNADGRLLSHVTHGERSALEFEIPDWDGNAVRDNIVSWHFYGLVPALMRQANPTTATTFLSEHGDNLSAWLLNLQTRHNNAFIRIKSISKDVFPELDDLFTWPTEQSTVFVASREKHLKRPVSVWQMSEGELAFIALLSLICAPPELGSPLYCLEEPENHLHPKLLEALVELLKQVQHELGKEQSGQLMVSTHSPQLVDKCDLEELVVIEKRDGATLCTRPSDKKHLRQLLDREEAGLGALFYSGALSGAE